MEATRVCVQAKTPPPPPRGGSNEENGEQIRFFEKDDNPPKKAKGYDPTRVEADEKPPGTYLPDKAR